jgi:hypothetical protein
MNWGICCAEFAATGWHEDGCASYVKTVSIPLSLLERLAPAQVPSSDREEVTCAFCLEPVCLGHSKDCPWLQARKLIEEVRKSDV